MPQGMREWGQNLADGSHFDELGLALVRSAWHHLALCGCCCFLRPLKLLSEHTVVFASVLETQIRQDPEL